MSDTLSRRAFLSYTGATLVGVTLGEWGRRRLARADEQAATWDGRGVERWAASVCRECPAGCSLRVRLIDDVPVKFEGNPLCPIARGRLCAKGQAAIESYFDPDRLVGPARRLGPRGENRWEPIGWSVAVEMLASELRAGMGTPGQVLAVSAEEHGPLAARWTRFWEAAGARTAWTLLPTAARLRSRLAAMTGTTGDPLFDLDHASHILSFGAPIVEDWLSPVWSQRSYGRFRRGDPHARGRLIHIDARQSLTARKADEWLGLSSEQHVFLAYGIASVLLRENRVNRSLVEEFGGNLSEFESEVVTRYPPDTVTALTGVPVDTVLRLARELIASPRPLAVVGADADPALIEAVFALDALIGAFDRPGGVFVSGAASPDLPGAAAALDDVAHGRLRPRLVTFRDASALRSFSTPADLDTALRATNLVVSFSPYLDEGASLADLLMPSHTALESWHALVPPPAVQAELVAIASPAAPARLNTRDLFEVLKATADAVGGPVGDASASWKSSADIVSAELDRLWNARRGAPYGDAFQTAWVNQLERGGWWVPSASSREEFEAAVLAAGGWMDPFFEPGAIRQSLRAHGGVRFAPTIAATGAAPITTPAAVVDQPQFPLRLVAFTPALVKFLGSSNQPGIFELFGQLESAPWQAWAEIHPAIARTNGITEGSRIRITSTFGSLDVAAHLVEGMPREVVALAHVPALRSGGRWARMIRSDARPLWGPDLTARTCAVRVSRV